ncbi:MAG: NADH:ubiquinone reductase (Na(+)-transporting) subunit D, partial [Bacteroidetes bacterium]
WPAFLDGIGNALGYGWILLTVAFFRELFGSGTIWNYPIMENLGFYDFGYKNNGFMILPPMALIVVGIIIWIQRSRDKELVEEK